jgi:hypothetical protein
MRAESLTIVSSSRLIVPTNTVVAPKSAPIARLTLFFDCSEEIRTYSANASAVTAPRSLPLYLKMIARVIHRIQLNEVLRHRLGLDLQKPPHILSGKLFVCAIEGRNNIEKRHSLSLVRVIEAHSMCNTTATVVTNDKKLRMPKLPHTLPSL